MRTALAVAVAAMLAGCGGPEEPGAGPAAEPAAVEPEVECSERWTQNVYTDDGRLCSYGTITVTVCRSAYPAEPPPEVCAAFR